MVMRISVPADTPPEPVETLRDRFAMLAAEASIVRGLSGTWAELAESSYNFADAMLAERERKP